MNRNSKYNHKINDHSISNPTVVHKQNYKHIAKGDSGASQHYITKIDEQLLHSKTTSNGQSVLLPNNGNIQSTTTGVLPLAQQLSTKACTAHVLPTLQTSLISLGQLADDKCTIILDKKYLHVIKNFKCILAGYRNYTDGLWDIPLQNPNYPTIQKLNVIIPKQQNISNLVQYYHACLFSPTKTTLLSY